MACVSGEFVGKTFRAEHLCRAARFLEGLMVDDLMPEEMIDEMSAEKIRVQIYSKMSVARKWEEACRLREVAWKLKAAGVRTQHPTWSHERVEAEVRKIFLYATT